MPSTCVFEFDRINPIYYSGETINGQVVLNTISHKFVNVVYILFTGAAKVRWNESQTRKVEGKIQTHIENFWGSETYINTRTNVLGEGGLPAGTHTYTFSIHLPLDCPTSCVERYGKIAYEVSLVVDRSNRYNNVFNKPLTVLQTNNLNMHPELLIPIRNEDIKYFCCWYCLSSPVISTLTIPFGGYAPGQRIHFTLHIDNQSQGYDLSGIEICLIQCYDFRARSPYYKTHTHINVLSDKIQAFKVRRLSKRIIKSHFAIPCVPPSSKDNNIIKVKYYIGMSVKTGCCHSDSEIQIPITIGTIPLNHSAENPTNVNQLVAQTSEQTDLPPSYENCNPPSYEEATHFGEMFVDTEVNEFNRTDSYIPKYPMYTNFTVPSAQPMEAPDVPLLPAPHNRYDRTD